MGVAGVGDPSSILVTSPTVIFFSIGELSSSVVNLDSISEALSVFVSKTASKSTRVCNPFDLRLLSAVSFGLYGVNLNSCI